MGNAYNIKHWVGTITDDPELRPGYESTPTFDPMFGFKNGRKERVMVATEAEMNAANLKPHERDFCAHYNIEWKRCMDREQPLLYRCNHEKHAWYTCKYEDFVIRAKEYERERRLRMRQQRIANSMKDEEMAA